MGAWTSLLPSHLRQALSPLRNGAGEVGATLHAGDAVCLSPRGDTGCEGGGEGDPEGSGGAVCPGFAAAHR